MCVTKGWKRNLTDVYLKKISAKRVKKEAQVLFFSLKINAGLQKVVVLFTAGFFFKKKAHPNPSPKSAL